MVSQLSLSSMQTRHTLPKTIIAIAVSILTWSSSFVFIRVALHHYSPGALALFRYLIVSVAMLFFYFGLKTRTKPTAKEFIQLFFIGFFGIGLYMIALNTGEITVSASVTSFIIGMNPIVSLFWAMLFFGEKMRLKRWVGVAISVIGLLIIAGSDLYAAKLGWGMLYLIFAVICAGMYNVAQKPLLQKFHPIEVAAITAWSGMIAMLPFFPAMMHQIPTAPWAQTSSIIYLGVIPGAIGYLTWCYALGGELPATQVSLTLYSLPIFCTLMGWLLIDEIPTLFALVGGCISLVGAWVATRR